MSLKQIIGQESVVSFLRSLLADKKTGISLLFYGPRGTGKAFAALQFAKALNCQDEGYDSCDNCSSCLRGQKLGYPDLHWITVEPEAESIKIEQIRSMQISSSLKPFEGRHKVYVLDYGAGLSEDAAHSLLKIVEEPPSDTFIIILAAALNSVLATISSRCQRLKFSNIDKKKLFEILCQGGLDIKQSNYLAKFCDGKAAQALSLSRPQALEQRDIVLKEIILSAHNKKSVDFLREKDSRGNNLLILMSWYRDIMLYKLGLPKEYLINEDRLEDIKKYSKLYDAKRLAAIIGSLSLAFKYVKSNINTKIICDNIAGIL